MSQSQQTEEAPNPFLEEYVFPYAAESVVSGSYERLTSHMGPLLAGAAGPLDGKEVADVGCGFGTGIFRLARFPLKSITGIDRSAAMIEFARMIFAGDSEMLESWLLKKSVNKIVPKHWTALLGHLKQRQHQYLNGRFMAGQGKLAFVEKDIFAHAAQNPESVDHLVSNHCMGWMLGQVRQVRPNATTREAVVEGLKAFASLLRPGGVAVVMGPDSFIGYKPGSPEDKYSREHGLACSPLHMLFSNTLGGLLKAEHGIDHPVPSWNPLIPYDDAKFWARDAGFVSCDVHCLDDYLVYQDAIDAYQVRAPMWIKDPKVTPAERIDLADRTAQILRTNGLNAEQLTPLREQAWYLVLKKAKTKKK